MQLNLFIALRQQQIGFQIRFLQMIPKPKYLGHPRRRPEVRGNANPVQHELGRQLVFHIAQMGSDAAQLSSASSTSCSNSAISCARLQQWLVNHGILLQELGQSTANSIVFRMDSQCCDPGLHLRHPVRQMPDRP